MNFYLKKLTIILKLLLVLLLFNISVISVAQNTMESDSYANDKQYKEEWQSGYIVFKNHSDTLSSFKTWFGSFEVISSVS